LTKKAPYKGLGADSEEKHEPVSDIDTAVVDSLKVLDPERPIREADIHTKQRSHPIRRIAGPMNDSTQPLSLNNGRSAGQAFLHDELVHAFECVWVFGFELMPE